MKKTKYLVTLCVATLAVSGGMASVSFAGQTQQWENVPEPVRATILAHGGKAGPVDLEAGEEKNGIAVYEANVKSKKGESSDLVITEDGKLVEVKHDDATDLAGERTARGLKLMEGVKFTHPTEITNPFLPLSSLKQDILEGSEAGKQIRIERTVLPNKHKKFKIGKHVIEALVMEDREFEGGELAEVATDYFAQDDAGTVYYLGEDVNEYENGKVKGHDGAWLLGKDTKVPGVILPGNPKIGDKFKTEDVSAEIDEKDEVISLSERVTVPAGTYENCVKVIEKLGDGTTEYKYYAKGVGVVREIPAVGDVTLKSHTAKN